MVTPLVIAIALLYGLSTVAVPQTRYWLATWRKGWAEDCAANREDLFKKLTTNNNNNNDCLRLATLYHTSITAKLGDQLTVVLLGIQLAAQLNATYVYNPAIWDVQYPFVKALFPFQENYVTRSQLQCLPDASSFPVVTGSWSELVQRQSQACNVFFQATMDGCCPKHQQQPSSTPKNSCSCLSHVHEWNRHAFAHSKALVRTLYYNQSTTTTTKATHSLYDNNIHVLNLAWHLSDPYLTNSLYLDHVATRLAKLATRPEAWRWNVTFFIGTDEMRWGVRSYLQDSLCAKILHGHDCHYYVLDEQNPIHLVAAMQGMIQSDVLLTSGSPLASIVALLKRDGLVFYGLNAEETYGIFELPEHGRISGGTTGGILVGYQQLGTQLAALFERKKRQNSIT